MGPGSGGERGVTGPVGLRHGVVARPLRRPRGMAGGRGADWHDDLDARDVSSWETALQAGVCRVGTYNTSKA